MVTGSKKLHGRVIDILKWTIYEYSKNHIVTLNDLVIQIYGDYQTEKKFDLYFCPNCNGEKEYPVDSTDEYFDIGPKSRCNLKKKDKSKCYALKKKWSHKGVISKKKFKKNDFSKYKSKLRRRYLSLLREKKLISLTKDESIKIHFDLLLHLIIRSLHNGSGNDDFKSLSSIRKNFGHLLSNKILCQKIFCSILGLNNNYQEISSLGEYISKISKLYGSIESIENLIDLNLSKKERDQTLLFQAMCRVSWEFTQERELRELKYIWGNNNAKTKKNRK